MTRAWNQWVATAVYNIQIQKEIGQHVLKFVKTYIDINKHDTLKVTNIQLLCIFLSSYFEQRKRPKLKNHCLLIRLIIVMH